MSNQTKDDLVDNTQQKNMETIQSNNEQPAQEDIKQEDLDLVGVRRFRRTKLRRVYRCVVSN